MSMTDADRSGPATTFPCRWEYRVIGTASARIRKAILNVIEGAEHSLTFSRFSQGGKYISFALEVTVRNEEHRNAIHDGLKSQPCIKAVL